MKNSRKILLVIFGIIIVLGLTVAGTYASWQKTYTQSNPNEIVAACLDIDLENNDSLKTGISFENAFPITDVKGLNLEGYSFKVTNKCNSEVNYSINLESINSQGNVSYLAPEYVKVNLDYGFINRYSDLEVATKVISDARDSRKLGSYKLSANSSSTHTLRLWISDLATTEQANKTFLSKITVSAGQGISETNNAKLLTAENASKNSTKDSVTMAFYDNGSLVVSGFGDMKDWYYGKDIDHSLTGSFLFDFALKKLMSKVSAENFVFNNLDNIVQQNADKIVKDVNILTNAEKIEIGLRADVSTVGILIIVSQYYDQFDNLVDALITTGLSETEIREYLMSRGFTEEDLQTYGPEEDVEIIKYVFGSSSLSLNDAGISQALEFSKEITSLKNVYISENLSSIGADAFAFSNFWEDGNIVWNIPSSVKKIGVRAFKFITDESTNTTVINLNEGLEEIGNYAFNTNNLTNDDGELIYSKINTIPSTVKQIGDYAFRNAKFINTTIDFTNTVVGSRALSNTNVTKLILPSGTFDLNPYTPICENCTDLTEVVVPTNIKRLSVNGTSGITGLGTPANYTLKMVGPERADFYEYDHLNLISIPTNLYPNIIWNHTE